MTRFRITLQRTLLASLLGLLVISGYVYGQGDVSGGTVSWSQPLKLGDGWWNSIATDREGGVHVAWDAALRNEKGVEIDALIYSAKILGGDWTPANDVIFTGLGGYTVRNALAVGNDGTLYAAFRHFVFHQFASAPAQTAYTAQSWSAPIDIDRLGYYIDLTVDRNDVLHIAYSGQKPDAIIQGSAETESCAYCYDLLYVRSTDGGHVWSTPFPLSDLTDSGSDRVKIWEAASGRLYVSWDEGVDWYIGRGTYKDVRLRYSDDGGLTWSDPIILDGGNLPGKHPFQGSFTEMADGRLMAVWRYASPDEPQIYYQISDDDGQTWSIPDKIDGFYARTVTDSSSTLDHISLETDYLGTTHLFAVGQADPASPLNVSLYHIEFRQGAWRLPQRVFYDPERRPEWPEVAFGFQNDIHLSFFTRKIPVEGLRQGERADTVPMEVWYMHRSGTLLSRPTQAFDPTITPLPTPTIFQQLDPTTTPFPTMVPRDDSFALVTRDTYAIETVIGGMFVAGIFCLVVIVGIRFRR